MHADMAELACPAMAGYSGTPLPRKLGIKPGHRLLLQGAPDGFETETLGELPDAVQVGRRASPRAAVCSPSCELRARA